MRHRVKGRKLGRTASHRQATLNALATQLLRYKKIKTTVAKAKETKKFVEPLITKAKNDNIGSRRHIAKFIKDKEVLKELFGEIVEKIGDRPGGYTRVVKLGHRLGDAAELAIVELVDYNEIHAQKKEAKDKAETKTAKSKKAPKKEEADDADVVEETKAKPKKVTKAKSTGTKKTTATKKATKSKKSDKDDKSEDK